MLLISCSHYWWCPVKIDEDHKAPNDPLKAKMMLRFIKGKELDK